MNYDMRSMIYHIMHHFLSSRTDYLDISSQEKIIITRLISTESQSKKIVVLVVVVIGVVVVVIHVVVVVIHVVDPRNIPLKFG